MGWFQPAVVSGAQETIKNLKHYEGNKEFISQPTLIFRALLVGGIAMAGSYRDLRRWAFIHGMIMAGTTYALESLRAESAVLQLFVREFCGGEARVSVGVLEYIAQDLQATKAIQQFEIIHGNDRMVQLLQVAVEKGNRAIACFLVEKVRDLEADKVVALWLAMKDREVARAIHKTEQFPINSVHSQGKTALFYALQRYIEKQDDETRRSVLLLLEYGAEVLPGTTTFTVRGETKDLGEWLKADATVCLALQSAENSAHEPRRTPSDYKFRWEWHKLYLRTFALAGTCLVALRLSRLSVPFFCLIAVCDVWYTERRLKKLAAEEFKSPLPTAEVLDEISCNWIKEWVDEEKDVSKVDHEGRSLFDRLLQGEAAAIDPYRFIDRLFEKTSPELLDFYFYKATEAQKPGYATYMLEKDGKRVELPGVTVPR